MLAEKIKALSKKYAGEFIETRHHLHQNPELSYQEFETARFVKGKLESFGIQCSNMANTGVIGIIEGRNPSKRVLALRADMDALPIPEANEVPYKSKKPGIMHACGHDVHTSILLGASRILNEIREDFEGTLKLIFQPGEERNPGGASLLIKEGVLENPRPQGILALHVHPGLEAGRLSFRPPPDSRYHPNSFLSCSSPSTGDQPQPQSFFPFRVDDLFFPGRAYDQCNPQ